MGLIHFKEQRNRKTYIVCQPSERNIIDSQYHISLTKDAALCGWCVWKYPLDANQMIFGITAAHHAQTQTSTALLYTHQECAAICGKTEEVGSY